MPKVVQPGRGRQARRLQRSLEALAAVVVVERRAGFAREDESLIDVGVTERLPQHEQAEAITPSAYVKLYPTCRASGCADDPEPREPYCYRHVLVDAV
jgi:hypothetical protein